ncbi:DUF3473 domain-containing protein [Paenibacillus sp. YYML68]|uniref:DUF3473 domain-containing protein n=1 Tax=Paenibacillus sp. YYML68 TaxID=2909250 RepID=UPI002492F8BD|nr:DUF3473 domain-containing protein [Paenibacillus sp. YYML68]
MLNALTVDVEDWYQTNDFNYPVETWGNYQDRVVDNTFRLLGMLEEHQVKGTFFILGCIAEKYPELVREIDVRGHEIGSHGGWHRMVSELSLKEFRRDVLYSRRMLERVTGKPVRLFRAPSWSISPDRYEVLTILDQLGFTCDSSIQPFWTPLSGVAGAPSEPYYPVVNGRQLSLLEFPPTVLDFGKLKVPFSGGFYMRALPYTVIAWALRQLNEKRAGMIYIHPWEIDLEQPVVRKVQPHRKLIHYHNLRTMEPKLLRLLKEFRFGTMSEVIRESYAGSPVKQLSASV